MLIEPINSPSFSSGTSAKVRAAAKFHGGHTQRIAIQVGLALADIVDLDEPLRLQQHPEAGVGAGTDGRTEQHLAVGSRDAVGGDHAEKIALAKPQIAELGAADVNGILQQRLEDRLQVAR